MIKRKISQDETPTFELTALIDIIFIIIVFLLLSSNEKFLNLDFSLSKTAQKLEYAQADDKNIFIKIDENSKFHLDEKEYESKTELRNEILRLNKDDLNFNIAAHDNSNTQSLLWILAFFKAQNISNINLILDEE